MPPGQGTGRNIRPQPQGRRPPTAQSLKDGGNDLVRLPGYAREYTLALAGSSATFSRGAAQDEGHDLDSGG